MTAPLVLPGGVVLASRWRRFAGFWLEVVLLAVTAGVGWLVWSLIVWRQAQTPAKQLLGMRVMDLESGRRFTWGQMLLREIVKCVLIVLLHIVAAATIFAGSLDQTIWDHLVRSTVVKDRAGLLR